MSSERKSRLIHSLALRLSLNYAACCCLSMVAVLAVCYLFLDGTLRKRMDAELASEIVEYGALLKSQDLAVLDDVLKREALSEGTEQVFFRILDPAGKVMISTDTSSWSGLMGGGTYLQGALAGRKVFTTFYDPERDFYARVLYGKVADNLVLQLGASQMGNRALLRQFRTLFMMATFGFVLCSLAAGAFMAHRALAGVQRVTQAAVHITAGAWEHRVPVSRHQDEIDDLAEAFNRMLDRIQVLFRELREVTDDIAHDLRTPLMRIRGEAEIALRDVGRDSINSEQLGSVLEECDQMLHLVNTMLEISQTEAGANPVHRRAMALPALVEDLCDLFRPAAEDKGVSLNYTADTMPSFAGDAHRLKRALAHLVDNAIKYTATGGRIDVRCCHAQGEFSVIVQDTGIGIPQDALEHVFNRFYRVDPSRTEPGNGLGLSLARAIVRVHGGEIAIDSTRGQGTVITVHFPETPV